MIVKIRNIVRCTICVCAAFGILLSLIVYVREWYYQQKIMDCFKDNQKEQPYARGIPLNEMSKSDFAVYKKYLPISVAFASPDLIENVILPCDVEYYADKTDTEPTLVLSEKVEVYFFPNENEPYIPTGYGSSSWPDYDKEWRYAYPFHTELNVKISDESQMYYVKAKQLEAVAREWYYTASYKDGRVTNAAKYARRIVGEIDRSLYYKGAFCSGYLNWRDMDFPE